LPLVVSDLPVILWWHPTRIDSERLSPFLDSVDKVVFDSSSESQALEFFQTLMSLLERREFNGRHQAFVDLNWRRSLPWRESLALAFDTRHSEISPDYLSGINSVTVAYGQANTACEGPIGATNQALLTIGWLASRLKWTLRTARITDKAHVELEFVAGARPVKVNLQAVPSDKAASGDVGSILIRCDQPKAVSILAKQERSTPGIVVACEDCDGVRGNGVSNALFELNEAPEGLLIDKELESLSTEPTFKPTVALVVDILRMLTQGSGS
jgi:glucose-6-phosphate dehydrogenase assembly protein OpcA